MVKSMRDIVEVDVLIYRPFSGSIYASGGPSQSTDDGFLDEDGYLWSDSDLWLDSELWQGV